MILKFKSWINIILGIGILICIIKLIIPRTSMSKYIYSLTGIITIILIITPVIAIFNGNINLDDIKLNLDSYNTQDVKYTQVSNYEEINKNNVKENFKSKLCNDIKENLKENIDDVDSLDVIINITDSYNIEKITIYYKEDKNIGNIENIKNKLGNLYDISKDKINVLKGE